MENACSVPGSLPRPLHTFTYLILVNGFSSLIRLGELLSLFEPRCPCLQSGEQRYGRWRWRGRRDAARLGSGRSRLSGKGGRYDGLAAFRARLLWFQQPSLDRVAAAISSPGPQWIPSLISQGTSCEVSPTHSSSSFPRGPDQLIHLSGLQSPAFRPHCRQQLSPALHLHCLLPSQSPDNALQPMSSSVTLLGS